MKYDRFVWDDSYSVNVKLIDEQHKHFFEIVNQSFDLLEIDPQNRAKIFAVIDELIAYGKFHLSTEERYFEQFNFIHSKEHIRSHNIFREKVDLYLLYLKNLKITDSVEDLAAAVTTFSKNWLSQHILISDKEYITLFNENGLK
jgi:hemerythrin